MCHLSIGFERSAFPLNSCGFQAKTNKCLGIGSNVPQLVQVGKYAGQVWQLCFVLGVLTFMHQLLLDFHKGAEGKVVRILPIGSTNGGLINGGLTTGSSANPIYHWNYDFNIFQRLNGNKNNIRRTAILLQKGTYIYIYKY